MDARLAIWASFIATYVATIGSNLFPVVGLPRVDLPHLYGSKIVPAGFSLQFAYLAGTLGHFIDGAIAGLVYARLFSPRIGLGGWLKGLIFGFLLTLVVWLIVLPLVFEAGFLGSSYGLKATLAVLVWHLIWGALLGAIYDDRGLKAPSRLVE